jgi:TPR repeat protein
MNLVSFCRRLFSGSSVSGFEATEARADQGDAAAQFGLGQKYSRGDAPDSPQAAEWYRKAAEQGHALAQYNLGLMYANGHGVARDDAEALLWIRKAAEGGDAGAQHNLGGRCHRASFRDRQADASECRIEAYKWLYLASVQGYKGSAAACEQVTLVMTSAELAEGNHRAASFVGPKAGNGNGR